MFELLRPYLRTPKHFIGGDLNESLLMKHVLDKVPFRLVWGDAFISCLYLLRETDTNLGVVNLDTTNGVREVWWEKNRLQLREMVTLGSKKCPSFTIILNHCLDRGGDPGTTVANRIKVHAKGLAEAFKDWGLTEKSLLKGAEPAMSTPGFTGRAGPYRLYSSEDHRLRMITIRLAFNTRLKRAQVDRRPV
jgi:hypothetical protein